MIFAIVTVLILPLLRLSLAIPLPSEPNQPAKRQDQAAAQGATWTLADKYEGQNFFEGWNFYSDPDPTHGFVKYEAQSAAMDQKLAVIDESGVVTLSVDAKTKPPEGVQAFNRSAVRITTKKRYNGGLFIANFSMMPVGCSTWPAYWMTEGTHWPDTGELDILEGVNGSPPNKITAHTGAGCSLQVNADAISGTPPASMPQTCENQPGCGVGDTTPSSFGPEFNQAGGGILVHRWTSTKIEVWHFKQGDAPQDIANGKPNPDSWGKPQFLLGGDQCVIKDHFVDNSLIINTSLCGDWAGGAWEQSSCNKKADGTPRTCQEAVADPTLFTDAKWKINFIHVYQSSDDSGAPSPDPAQSSSGPDGTSATSADPAAPTGDPNADPSQSTAGTQPPQTGDPAASQDPSQTVPGSGPPTAGEVALAATPGTETAPGASPSPSPSPDGAPPAGTTPM